MRFILFLITVSHVVAFFNVPISNNFLRRFSTQDPSDEYHRVLKLIEMLATESAKTDEQLRLLTKESAKTEKQLRSLIGYNQNRDEELEFLIEEALIKKLKDAEWTVSRAGFTEIIRSDGRILVEWDGILQCKHEKSSKEVLAVIETKQIMTVEKFENFKLRLMKTKRAIKNSADDDDLFFFKDFLLCGVIGSPVIREDVDTSGFTYITLKQDQYEVNLEPTIFNSTVL